MQQSSAAPCICFRVRRASRALTRLYDEALAPAGLTVTQFSILRNSERLDGPTLSQLAEHTGHERSALWRTVQPLARQGLLTMEAGKDERTRRLRVTDAGREAMARGEPHWRETQAKVESRLGEEDQRRLVALLKEIEALVP